MKHRHLNDNVGLTSAAIDDVLDRGSLADWLELRDAAKRDRSIADKIVTVCRSHEMYGTSSLWLAMMDRLYGLAR
jgi:hypothetical protein